MEGAACDARHVAWHKREHAAFLKQFRSLTRVSGTDTREAVASLSSFLANWLAYHMLGADLVMARQLEAIRGGRAPAQAFDEEVREQDPVTAALLDALGGLVAAVSARNHALAEMQEMLRRANLGLEARVEMRTRELETANAELTDMVQHFKAVQDQLLQADKMASIGVIAAGVAHEINNPIGFVNSNLGTLRQYIADLLDLVAAYEAEESALADDARARLAAVKDKADLGFLRGDILDLMKESREGLDRVTRVVQDLKEFSRVDDAQWVRADLVKGLESTLNVVSNEIKYKAEVVREYGDVPPVLCRPAQLNQVFMNLLVNAAQAIESHGTITLRSGVAADRVWVEIEDTGSGMTPDVQKHVFETFYTTKPVGKGTGLGLSIAHGIVEKHGGEIELASTPGVGTRFRIWLPMREAAPAEDPPGGTANRATG